MVKATPRTTSVSLFILCLLRGSAMNFFILIMGPQGVCPDQVRRVTLAHGEAPGQRDTGRRAFPWWR